MRSGKVLLTGFEPFGGERINPSALAVTRLSGENFLGRAVVSTVLPCVFDQSIVELEALLCDLNPELVICVGQAGGSDAINLESTATNLDNAEMPDNAGAQPKVQRIDDQGPERYPSSLPLGAISTALATAGIKSSISASAGSFVCNHVFYGLMRALRDRPDTLGGFIHVPYLPEQTRAMQAASETPSMPLDRITEALRISVVTALSSAL
jgi:pyroglutamyl-peptidase